MIQWSLIRLIVIQWSSIRLIVINIKPPTSYNQLIANWLLHSVRWLKNHQRFPSSRRPENSWAFAWPFRRTVVASSWWLRTRHDEAAINGEGFVASLAPVYRTSSAPKFDIVVFCHSEVAEFFGEAWFQACGKQKEIKQEKSVSMNRMILVFLNTCQISFSMIKYDQIQSN